MLQLYHLESKIDFDERYQKVMEELISDINKKTQELLKNMKEQEKSSKLGF